MDDSKYLLEAVTIFTTAPQDYDGYPCVYSWNWTPYIYEGIRMRQVYVTRFGLTGQWWRYENNRYKVFHSNEIDDLVKNSPKMIIVPYTGELREDISSFSSNEGVF